MSTKIAKTVFLTLLSATLLLASPVYGNATYAFAASAPQAFADCRVNIADSGHLCLTNPTDVDVDIYISYIFESGYIYGVQYAVPANGVYVVYPDREIGSAVTRLSVEVYTHASGVTAAWLAE